jgi:hypothetical protein
MGAQASGLAVLVDAEDLSAVAQAADDEAATAGSAIEIDPVETGLQGRGDPEGECLILEYVLVRA